MNFEALKEYLDSLNERGDGEKWTAPGSNTVVFLDHECVFSYSTGYADVENKIPTDTGKLYNIYSCSKIATSVAATQLIEKGIINVNDPLYKYIPEFKNVKVRVTNEKGEVIGLRDPKTPILLRHILTMTSGMGYDIGAPAVRKVVEQTNGRAPTLDVCRAFAEVPLYFDPGEDYMYSFGLDIMGGVIEVASGEPFSEYVKKNIFDPLGMTNTTYHPDFSDPTRFAVQYELTPSGKPERKDLRYNPHRIGTEFDGGGAGIATTTDDYILFLDALANGGVGKNGNRIITAEGIDLIRTGALCGKSFDTFSTGYNIGYDYGYGVRICIDRSIGGNLVSLGTFGWDGWKMCVAVIDPEKKLAMFHTEYLEGYHPEIIPKLRNVLYRSIGW